jgi:lantibiotic biosynthesis protein
MIPMNAVQVDCLQTAEGIGRHIAHTAVWHGDRCNWVGANPVEQLSPSQSEGIYQALGPDLYSGTGGVALFLAELYAATEEPLARRIALGAMRQTLSRLDAVVPGCRLGLFSGWPGIAVAAARAGILLDETALTKQAQKILERLATDEYDELEFDLISGKAGAIAALLVIANLLDDQSAVSIAARFGDELVDRASKSNENYSWVSPHWRNQRHLTGFSHGTAGAGYALLELFHATHELKYRDAALRAFHYERHWFDPEVSNWPDFRGDPFVPYRKKAIPKFATFWCHGAPGIALSRLRAYEILNEPGLKTEALAALETTGASLQSALDNSSGNFSMCHGLAGNAAVLNQAAAMPGVDWKEGRRLPLAIAEYGMERYARRGVPWPCGTHSGEAPGFMLGLAGIGHFYLQLAQPSTPSVLLPCKEKWRGTGPGAVSAVPATSAIA